MYIEDEPEAVYSWEDFIEDHGYYDEWEGMRIRYNALVVLNEEDKLDDDDMSLYDLELVIEAWMIDHLPEELLEQYNEYDAWEYKKA